VSWGVSCSVRSDRNELRDLRANSLPFKLDLRNLFLLQHAFLQAARVCFRGTGIPYSIKYSLASGVIRCVMVLGTLVCSPFNHLTWRLAQEYFIGFSRHESFKLGIPYVSRLGNLLYFHHLIMSI